jgi:hypothetical protein
MNPKKFHFESTNSNYNNIKSCDFNKVEEKYFQGFGLISNHLIDRDEIKNEYQLLIQY